MYTKLYKTIFDGSLYGRFEALTVFMAMLALSDRHGDVDASYAKIAGCLGCKLSFVKKGIKDLESPDPESRTPELEGRRIVPLDNDEGDKRPFGWKIVNYEKYRKIRNEDERRAYKKKWDQDNRGKKKNKPTNSDQARPKTTHTEGELEVDTKDQNKSEKISDNPFTEKKPKSKTSFTPEDLETAQWIFHRIQKLNPNHREPKFKNWANEIRKMRERDGRTDAEIRQLFKFANEDDFWCTNILGPSKLRKQWDVLTLRQLKQPKTGKNAPSPIVTPKIHPALQVAKDLGLVQQPGQSDEDFKDFALKEQDRLNREKYDT